MKGLTLKSLTLASYDVTNRYGDMVFDEDKLSHLNLRLQEIVLNQFVIKRRNVQVVNVISFIASQKRTLQRLKFVQCDILKAEHFAKFAEAAAYIKELTIENCDDISWLKLLLAEKNLRLKTLIIIDTALSAELVEAIAENRHKIDSVTMPLV